VKPTKGTTSLLAEIGAILAEGYLRLRADFIPPGNEPHYSTNLTPCPPSNYLAITAHRRHRCHVKSS